MTTKTPIYNAENLIQSMSETKHIEIRDNRGMVDGEAAQQGDVYVIKVKNHSDIYNICRLDQFRRKALRRPTTERQVAPGNTIGSRHIVEGKNLQIIAAPVPGSEIEGPTIIAEDEWTLTHPEHAHHKFGPGTYVCIFQQDWATGKRVQD